MKMRDAIIAWLTTNKRAVKRAEAERFNALKELEEYKNRFRKIGAAEVETFAGGPVKTIEAEWEPWGCYKVAHDGQILDDVNLKAIKRELAYNMAEMFIKNDYVQYIVKTSAEYGGPLEEMGTVGIKLYVIPWEELSRFTRKIQLEVYEEAGYERQKPGCKKSNCADREARGGIPGWQDSIQQRIQMEHQRV